MSKLRATPKENSGSCPTCPKNLQGLFEHDGVYSAVVRFSNAASQAQPDAIPDGRGMAIKYKVMEGDIPEKSKNDFILFFTRA